MAPGGSILTFSEPSRDADEPVCGPVPQTGLRRRVHVSPATGVCLRLRVRRPPRRVAGWLRSSVLAGFYGVEAPANDSQSSFSFSKGTRHEGRRKLQIASMFTNG